MILIQCLLKNSRMAEARAEFQALLDLDPPDRDRLQAWFSRIPASRSRSVARPEHPESLDLLGFVAIPGSST